MRTESFLSQNPFILNSPNPNSNIPKINIYNSSQQKTYLYNKLREIFSFLNGSTYNTMID